MARYFCHEHPDVLTLATRVVDARPGAVVLEQTPFYPGGGGQLADRGLLRSTGGETAVVGLEWENGRLWHRLAAPVELSGAVEAVVDAAFRSTMAELHTGTHILNALVYQQFRGALVTGAQLNDDATARMDFDLPDADNERLRGLEPQINDVIRQDLAVRYAYVPLGEAVAEHGLIRSRSVAPPGVRRHAPGLDRPLASDPDPQDRQQGPAQPARAHRPGVTSLSHERGAPGPRRGDERRGVGPSRRRVSRDARQRQPRRRRGVARLERLDLRLVPERQRDLVLAGEQAFLAERIDTETEADPCRSSHGLRCQINGELVAGLGCNLFEQLHDLRGLQHNRQHAVLKAVIKKDVSEAGGDDAAEPIVEQCPGRVLA
jgi:misacylated tRNA(Ala) deacylase